MFLGGKVYHYIDDICFDHERVKQLGCDCCVACVQRWPVFVEMSEIFILVPALLGLKGNLEMTLAARLSTQVCVNAPACWRSLCVGYNNDSTEFDVRSTAYQRSLRSQ